MSALAAVSTMLLVWQSFDPRVVLFFIAYMVLTEILVQLRWRLSVICPHCGFDPVLYLKDSNKAAQKVKNHLEKRKSDPATLFKPPVKLPSVKAKADHSIKNFEASQPETSQRLKSGKSKSSIISKQI